MTDTQTISEETAPSHFERIGGGPAIRAAVDRLYELILADPELAGFFTGTDMPRQKGHMAALLTSVLGGPEEYAGRDLGVAHRGLGITTAQFTTVAGYLVQTLRELSVPEDIIAHAGSVVTSVAPAIIEEPAGVATSSGGQDG
jgi:hemoglobin